MLGYEPKAPAAGRGEGGEHVRCPGVNGALYPMGMGVKDERCFEGIYIG